MLFGVDLDVESGECVALLGRNGAGKTTTLRSIVGADVPNVTAGSVTFDGEELLGEEAYQIAERGIAFVPEERRYFPALTVEENIQVASNHAADPKGLEEVIEQINEEQGITVLFVEQNVAMALSIADRHYILDEGRIVEQVTSEELRADEQLRQQYLGV